MTSRPINRLILGLLFLLSFGTSGIAITLFPFLKINSCLITVDCDSFRAEHAAKLAEALHNNYFFKFSNKDIYDLIAASQPIEHVVVKYRLFKPLQIDITATKPVVMVSNQKQLISLSTLGTPLQYWPEHGHLPCYGVPSDFDIETLLHPSSLLEEFYRLIVDIEAGNFPQLTRFSNFVSGDENSITLLDLETGDQLKLPREHIRNRTEHLHNIDVWLSSHIATDDPMEFDARFPRVVILRSLLKGVHHG
ncbi:MAG: hypothetical protein WBM02_07185 [bacterium]